MGVMSRPGNDVINALNSTPRLRPFLLWMVCVCVTSSIGDDVINGVMSGVE